MPRIPPVILDCVCYLYEDEEKARAGTDFGGTGFFVSVPSRAGDRMFLHVVTNHHVACTGGSSVIRVNTHDGGTDVIPLEPHEWHFDPRFDIAVAPIGLAFEHHKFRTLPISMFMTAHAIERDKIGVGEDIFMVGRFINHDGGPINRPAVRFGNISVMPSPIEQPNRHMADAFCIDVHSKNGYSGSPVFIYRMPGYDLEEKMPEDFGKRHVLIAGNNYLALLGIHFAQFVEEWEMYRLLLEPLKRPLECLSLPTEGM